MNRFLCVHGHFYQPPRENPWLERIEYQASAYPFHDWNDRINAECYGPNALSRILDGEEWVTELVNNYSKISFNFGPTLLSWMETVDPKTYQAIIDGDRLSRERYNGHGSAIAQAYNHAILPLSNRRDKETQVIWGIRDFERRFGRYPEALWLPETAVDTETLEILAAHGMKYVILAPRQAQQFRALGSDEPWQDATGETIAPTRPYLVRLPGGKSIAAFFYDGPISRAVAFEGLLHDGKTFAGRLLSGFNEELVEPQLMHIATDGETYGHHHRHGEMALSYALHHVESNGLARLINYGEFLELHPPKHEVEIVENSSWSCIHGVERWRSDCGCNSGMHGGWHQKWRGPFRAALDYLRDGLAEPYEQKLRELVPVDPWELRNAYIDVILDRSEGSRAEFLARWMRAERSHEKLVLFFRLLELQRQLLLMYTSCGWFFDEISGLETEQCIKYAYRAIQLAEEALDVSLYSGFAERMAQAPSNVQDIGHGRTALERHVMPAKVGLLRLGGTFATTSLFEDYGEETEFYCYKVRTLDFQRLTAGKASMAVGKIQAESRITLNSGTCAFAVIHFGDHNVNAGIRWFQSDESYASLVARLKEAFNRADFAEAIRVLDQNFKEGLVSIKSLFHDERAKVLQRILGQTLSDVEAEFRQRYELYNPLMRFLATIDSPLPKVFRSIAEFAINASMQRILKQDPPDAEELARTVEAAGTWEIVLDRDGLQFQLKGRIRELMEAVDGTEAAEERLARIQGLLELTHVAKRMPFPVDLSHAQNKYYQWKSELFPRLADPDARNAFLELGTELRVRLPQ